MNDTPASPADASTLKWLKVLVMTLTITIIVGFVIIVGLFIAKFNSFGPASPAVLPDRISLPDGTAPEAFTVTAEWYAVITADGEILVYDRADGALRKRIQIAGE